MENYETSIPNLDFLSENSNLVDLIVNFIKKNRNTEYDNQYKLVKSECKKFYEKHTSKKKYNNSRDRNLEINESKSDKEYKQNIIEKLDYFDKKGEILFSLNIFDSFLTAYKFKLTPEYKDLCRLEIYDNDIKVAKENIIKMEEVISESLLKLKSLKEVEFKIGDENEE